MNCPCYITFMPHIVRLFLCLYSPVLLVYSTSISLAYLIFVCVCRNNIRFFFLYSLVYGSILYSNDFRAFASHVSSFIKKKCVYHTAHAHFAMSDDFIHFLLFITLCFHHSIESIEFVFFSGSSMLNKIIFSWFLPHQFCISSCFRFFPLFFFFLHNVNLLLFLFPKNKVSLWLMCKQNSAL